MNKLETFDGFKSNMKMVVRLEAGNVTIAKSSTLNSMIEIFKLSVDFEMYLSLTRVIAKLNFAD